MSSEKREQRHYDTQIRQYQSAVDERKLELNLFWQRSIFFWGFIASAFIAFAAIKEDPALRLLVSCFGLICAFAWTLANRGSKYWYEAWEQKVNMLQNDALGKDLYTLDIPTLHPDKFWSGRRYSVTRLAIGLSDFTVFIWALLLITAATRVQWDPTNWPVLIGLWCTPAYLAIMLRSGRFAG